MNWPVTRRRSGSIYDRADNEDGIHSGDVDIGINRIPKKMMMMITMMNAMTTTRIKIKMTLTLSYCHDGRDCQEEVGQLLALGGECESASPCSSSALHQVAAG